MFRRLGHGDIDLLVSAWPPASHGAYLRPFADGTRRVTILYEPFCIWGVPGYIPATEVAGVADLLNPAVAARMEKRVQGINSGAGISRFSEAIVEQYGLAAAGYLIELATERDCSVLSSARSRKNAGSSFRSGTRRPCTTATPYARWTSRRPARRH